MTQQKILVVDDDPDIVLTYRLVLESAGYTIEEAASGEEALATMRESRPDLVLMDVMMANPLDGYYTTQQISDDPELREIPILMISSITTSQYAAAFPTDQYLDIREFVSKPVEPEVLLGKVKQNI